MADARGGVLVQGPLLGGVGLELALHAARAGEHGVEAAEDVGGLGLARGGGAAGILEVRLEDVRVLFDVEVGGAKVFAQELVGQAEEELILFGFVFLGLM